MHNMEMSSPPLDKRSSADIVAEVKQSLRQCDWQGREGGAGGALVQLFGRLVELIINRLNRVPNKHFMSFLNSAGVERLPPCSADTELTFIAADDGPSAIKVPAGTQAATVQTETQPEVIFETQCDLLVTPSKLVQCIAFDPLQYADYTSLVAGKTGSPFAAFRGDTERERILYLGDHELFTFDDEASRNSAVINLIFFVSTPADSPADGQWELKWLYWDGNTWAEIEEAGTIIDDQNNDTIEKFSRSGRVKMQNLPEFVETEVAGKNNLWLACKLTGGTDRSHLPVFSSIAVDRTIKIDSAVITADIALSSIQSGSAFVVLDPGGEFFPLGRRPGRLDTFYLMSDEAFTKPGAGIILDFDLIGVPEDAASDQLDKLTIIWEYFTQAGWKKLGECQRAGVISGSDILNFNDTTKAFTQRGEVSFDVPPDEQTGNSSAFAKTAINGQEGHWIRARITDGGYDVPGTKAAATSATYEWIEPKNYAPFVTALTLSYTGYNQTIAERIIEQCLSRVDGLARDHVLASRAANAGPDQSVLAAEDMASIQLDASGSRAFEGEGIVRYIWRYASSKPDISQTFAPFSAAREGHGLCLGFEPGLPAGKWIQVLLDVHEETFASAPLPPLYWEYWNGNTWSGLRVSDDSQGLKKRGYLGFFVPQDHRTGSEFGRDAHWIKVRPRRPPQADAGTFQAIIADDGEARPTLDAAGSQAFECQTIKKYIWRLKSSVPPLADAGEDLTAKTTAQAVTLQLNASASYPAQGKTIAKYIWHLSEPGYLKEPMRTATPYLKAIRLNTVSARDAVTIRDEVLGSSDGKPDQIFPLLRPPVMPEAQIAVREPDRPPDDELNQLQQELYQDYAGLGALLPMPANAADFGVWIRWRRVSDLHNSGPSSRHFTLDSINGRILFGDGKSGKIPPVGLDNIKAVQYRTHNGAKGNVDCGTITALRNPSGDLAHIKSVTNAAAAAGGSEAESITQLKLRGPQTLKHRYRAVTLEDFEWLALEASGEVAGARCLPARNSLGLQEPGWLTVVVTPKTAAAKPTPSPALLRLVKIYLSDRALTNLKETTHIHVTGPRYIEAMVRSRILPVDPEKSDEIELAVLEALKTFLHPLRGGPERAGWELGRDVYLSEIFAEIEAVSGVDHVCDLSLQGSLQQYRLGLEREDGKYRKIPYFLPVESQISTFDEQKKMLLAEPLIPDGELKSLAVFGFKVGDQVSTVRDNNTPLVRNLTISSITESRILFAEPFKPPINWDSRSALLSVDGRLRLPLITDDITTNSNDEVTGVYVKGFQNEDRVSVVAGTQRESDLELLPIDTVEPCRDRIFIPEGHLIYSGDHDIEMVLD
jgi:hypothetical protein